MFLGGIKNLSSTVPDTSYGSPIGISDPSPTEANVTTLSSGTFCVARNLKVYLTSPPGTNMTRTFTIRAENDAGTIVDTFVNCSIVGNILNTCTSTINTQGIEANRKISIKATSSSSGAGSLNTADASFAWECYP
jgi:hypothetical protein